MKFNSNKFIRWFAPLTICLIVLLVTLNYLGLREPIKRSDSMSSVKRERWQTMEERVATWGDALGLGIDPGIKKMVKY